MDTSQKRVLFNETTPEKEGKSSEKNRSTFHPVSESGEILVHPTSHNPTKTWQELQVKQTVKKVKPLSRKTPISPKKVRFVCISDTHNRTSRLSEPIPDGDVLLHAGDFTMVGHPSQVEEFNSFLGTLPHRRKVVIAGNHDLSFDKDMLADGSALRRFGLKQPEVMDYLKEAGIESMSRVLTNCTDYLEDTGVEICGIKIHGSPWQPEFGDWGFNLPRGQACLDKWNMIPAGTDVLITHGPPIGHGDLCFSEQRAGCVELLHTIQHRVKPQYHVFGHIHEGYGVTSDGSTTFINASTCTLNYKCSNPAIIFDIPLPLGHTKEELLNVDPPKGKTFGNHEMSEGDME